MRQVLAPRCTKSLPILHEIIMHAGPDPLRREELLLGLLAISGKKRKYLESPPRASAKNPRPRILQPRTGELRVDDELAFASIEVTNDLMRRR